MQARGWIGDGKAEVETRATNESKKSNIIDYKEGML